MLTKNDKCDIKDDEKSNRRCIVFKEDYDDYGDCSYIVYGIAVFSTREKAEEYVNSYLSQFSKSFAEKIKDKFRIEECEVDSGEMIDCY